MGWTRVVGRGSAVVLALGLVLTGCGDDDDTATDGDGGPTSSVPAADLTDRLLTPEDVPGDWQAVTEATAADFGSAADLPCADTAVNPTIAERLAADAGVILEPADGSLLGIRQVLVAGEADQLDSDLEAVFGALESCIGGESIAPDGERLTSEVFPVPELGDQRTAVTTLVGEPPDFETTWRVHTLFVRVDDVAMQLTQFEIVRGGDEPTVTDDDVLALFETAVDRLEG
ncbi:MAG: hypothetical protein MUE34_03585 [Acidimicrobiales bacterium]|jgi:hypothetical protein|nr:hypothetical protein [Acidimicrobiales bacterium]